MGRIVLYVRDELATRALVSSVLSELGLNVSLDADVLPWKGLCTAVIPWDKALWPRLDAQLHHVLPCTPFQLDCIPADGKNAAEFVWHTTHDEKWLSFRAVEVTPKGADWPSDPHTLVFPDLERAEHASR